MKRRLGGPDVSRCCACCMHCCTYGCAATVQRASPEQPAECYPAVLPSEQPQWRTEQAPHAHPPHCCRTVFIIFFLPETKASATRHAACGMLPCMLCAAVHAVCVPLSSSPAALRLAPPVALVHAACVAGRRVHACRGRAHADGNPSHAMHLRATCRACLWSAST